MDCERCALFPATQWATSGMPMVTAKEVCRGCAAFLRRHGWTTGMLIPPFEPVEVGERVWCSRCQTRHLCAVDHGPDGHGGSSICCPVRALEYADRHRRQIDDAILNTLHAEREIPYPGNGDIVVRSDGTRWRVIGHGGSVSYQTIEMERVKEQEPSTGG